MKSPASWVPPALLASGVTVPARYRTHLCTGHVVCQVRKGHLGLNHPELCQVASCVAVLSPECGTCTLQAVQTQPEEKGKQERKEKSGAAEPVMARQHTSAPLGGNDDVLAAVRSCTC